MRIEIADLRHPAIAALLRLHRAEALASTPAENAHALDAMGLADPDITLFAAWRDEVLLGIAALRALPDRHGEVKSMRTAPDTLRRGVARALLRHVVAVARARSYRRLSLETGTSPAYAAANRLYDGEGFVDGPVFGGYPASPHNRFMTLALAKETTCPVSS